MMGRYDAQPRGFRVSEPYMREPKIKDSVTDYFSVPLFGSKSTYLPEDVQKTIRDFLSDGPIRLATFLRRFGKSSDGGHQSFMMSVTVSMPDVWEDVFIGADGKHRVYIGLVS